VRHTGQVLLAAFYGALAASALLAGALLAYGLRPSPRLTAIVMAMGSGLLIGSVAYDLVADAQGSIPIGAVALSLLCGAAVFVLGSRLIARRGGGRRKSPSGGAAVTDGAKASDNPLAIVLGSALDGIPESFVLGLSVLHGGVSAPLLIGIGLSNLPEGMAASSGLRARGWREPRVLLMWAVVVGVSAISAALGHELLASDDGTLTGIVQTFAAGALLAMIADTMVPESYEIEREWTGGLVVAGFSLSLLIAAALGP
jgi:ZIP family zinc transporter